MVAKLSALKLLLIIAKSGRLLADSAHRAGYQVLVIDQFGDCDTAQLAVENWVVELLTIDFLRPLIDKLANRYTVDQVLIGSGFETQPETLFWLQTKFKLLGNSTGTVKRIGNPQGFSHTLKNLQIDQPETRFHRPENITGKWLVKPDASEGGLGIQFYHGQTHEIKVYWQRYQPGQVYSLLFVADGVNAKLLGINRQWCTEHPNEQVFIFSGVMVDQEAIVGRHTETLQTWMAKLTAEYGLMGLNGIDFIVDDNQCWFLEINPRPPASIALYAQDIDLINLHIDACNGYLPEIDRPTMTQIKAYQIVYAQAPVIIRKEISWPQWASDRPWPETIIDTQQPICSIIASANKADSVLQILRHRTQTIYQLLNIKGLA